MGQVGCTFPATPKRLVLARVGVMMGVPGLALLGADFGALIIIHLFFGISWQDSNLWSIALVQLDAERRDWRSDLNKLIVMAAALSTMVRSRSRWCCRI